MRRIIKREDGGIAVVIPAPKSRRKDEAEQTWLARVFAKATPIDVEYVDVPASVIPSDRTFRDAWEKNGNGIAVNMAKAKAIHIDRWRVARKPLLEKLDVAFMLALEADDKIQIAEIKAKKQTLRDVTKIDLSAIVNPEDLKKVWPEILSGLT